MPKRPGTLIVSDLHLSSGRDDETGHISRTEDFLFDDEFCAFLDYHMNDPRWIGTEWTLVINGDFMDLLQVTEEPDPLGPLRSDSVYGLKAGPQESAWKLKKVVTGHADFFEKLGEFVQAHKLVLVTGNHDIEFNYPEVRETFVEELAVRGGTTPETITARIEFQPWFHYDGSLYVEHGNQYDGFNSFRSMLEPRLPESSRHEGAASRDVELPPGSLFVRYLFNRVETDSPFADNIKPATRFLAWVISHHPLRALGFLVTDGREMLFRFREKWCRETPASYRSRDRNHEERLRTSAQDLAGKFPGRSPKEWETVLERIHALSSTPIFHRSGLNSRRWLRLVTGPYRTPLVLFLLCLPLFFVLIQGFLPFASGFLPATISGAAIALTQILDGRLLEFARWLALLEIVLILVWVRRQNRPDRDRNRLRSVASEIQKQTGAKVVVMGHTHEPDLWPLTGGARYFNVGTWTKIFSREDQVIREEKELTFLRILYRGNAPKCKLMKWEGQRGEARLAYVFGDFESSR